MKLEIRLAGPQDVEEVASMIMRLKSLNEELDPRFKTVENLSEIVEDYVKKTITSDKAFVLLAQSEDGDVAGMVRVELEDRIFYVPRIVAVVSDIYVKPKYRRLRVATLLLERVKQEARRRGAGMLVAIYPANNMIAENFYSKAGFRLLQVQKYISL
ncbi:MAG: GNAT family N-acetyltransferase [Acidilobaceae archaeon]|nr:GNAT family N-acetyltransferase [Acidilobaceae archaeon]